MEDIPDLQAAREAIEKIDRELMDVLKKRFGLVKRVAELKIDAAFPFRDERREELVLQRVRQVAAEAGLDPHQVEGLYRRILDMSVSHQLEHVRESGRTPLRVTYQGVEGSFSHITAQRKYRGRSGGVLLTGCDTFRQAADAVRTGTADVALLPIENSTAGSINDTYNLLAEGGLAINAEVITHVEHCLVGLPGSRIEDLRAVLSHPQALQQCEAFLQSLPHVRAQAEFDTAGSARKVKEQGDKTLAAIASENAARLLGLEVLRENIQSEMGNYTRFVEVATEAAACPQEVPCKTSLILATGDHPGELDKILAEFSRRGINLTKLESRPIPSRPWRYRFYLDLQGHASASPLAEALEDVAALAAEMRVLGTYPRAETESSQPPISRDDTQ